jgi:hypothetical protein
MKMLKTLKTELLSNPAVSQAYAAQAPEFELAHKLIAAGAHAGMSQSDVAVHMGTNTQITWQKSKQ